MYNNDKKWLASFFSGRQAQVQKQNFKSKYRILINGVPQGCVLSLSLFRLFLCDLPNPPPNVTNLTYADNIAIAVQHHKIQLAANTLQQYIHTLER